MASSKGQHPGIRNGVPTLLLFLLLSQQAAFASLSNTGAELFTQDVGWVPDQSEDGDAFGHALASCDFDGNGIDDLAIGVPREGLIGGFEEAGQVTIIYGTAFGLEPNTPQEDFFAQSLGLMADQQEDYDQFGYSLAVGYFDSDIYCDLAIGIPLEDIVVGGALVEDAGAVAVLYGGASGLSQSGNQFLSQHTPQLNGVPEENDYFGNALAAGDWNGDGLDDLAVGVPGESVFSNGSNVPAAGAVNIIYGSAAGLSPTLAPLADHILTQANFGAAVEANDFFGLVLAAGDFNPSVIFGADDLVIGTPDEDVQSGGNNNQAGAVFVSYGLFNQGLMTDDTEIFTQDSAGLPLGEVEPGDRFGRALAVADFDGDGADDLAVGSPFETVDFGGGQVFFAGLVHVLYGNTFPGRLSTAGSVVITREMIDGAPAQFDEFGRGLAAGHFDNDSAADLVIGVPRAEVGAATDAGLAFAIAGGPGNTFELGTAFTLSQEGAVPGVEEGSDQFGDVFAVGDFDGDGDQDLAVGLPLENQAAGPVDSGAVNVFYSDTGVILPPSRR